MKRYKRKISLVPVVLFAVSFGWFACNDQDTLHDDTTEAEFNGTRLPGNEKPNEYNVTPTLNSGTHAPNTALSQPVAPKDTAKQNVRNTSKASAQPATAPIFAKRKCSVERFHY